MSTTTIAEIRPILAAHDPCLIQAENKVRAAVAMIFHEHTAGLRLLFVERARHQGDPWSGHLAFPGGTVEPQDEDMRATAERETFEEIRLDLQSAECLGRLDDLTGNTLPVLVSGFVYQVEHPGAFELSDEISEAFWTPLSDLVDARRQVDYKVHYSGEERSFPAIDLLGPGRPVLWGITYRFVAQFLQLTGHQLPHVSL